MHTVDVENLLAEAALARLNTFFDLEAAFVIQQRDILLTFEFSRFPCQPVGLVHLSGKSFSDGYRYYARAMSNS